MTDLVRDNIALNEREIEARLTRLESKPRLLMMVLTNACNLNCIMCGRSRSAQPVTLPLAAARKAVELFPTLEAIDWQGGETFMVPYFKELFREAARFPDIHHSIITNGLLLDREWAELAARTGTSLTFSVDSVQAATYERIRRGGDFGRLVENLRLVRAAGPDGRHTRFLNVVVMRSNYREVELFPAFCAEHDVGHLRFDFLRPDTAPEEDILLRKDPEAAAFLLEALPRIRKACADAGIRFYCSFDGLLKENPPEDGPRGGGAPGDGGAPQTVPMFCKLPWKKLTVDACREGGVFPDCLCQHKVGSIHESGLLEIWNGEGMVRYREAMAAGRAAGLCSPDCLRSAVDESHFEGMRPKEAQEAEAGPGAERKVITPNETLNAEEIRRGETVLRSLPLYMHLLLTTRCNMRCPFCWERKVDHWDLPPALCPQVAELFPTLRNLVWQGGEAILHPSFRELMEEAVRHPYLGQTLLTNGAFLDEKWLDLFLRAPRLNVVLPVESVRAEDYARLRPGGNFARLERGLRLIQEAQTAGRNLKFMLNVIVMRSNALQLGEICDWAIANNFERVILTPIYPTVHEFYSQEFVAPDDPELGPAMREAFARAGERARAARMVLEDRFFGDLPAAAAASRGGVMRCFAPWRQVFIGCNGEVSSHCACKRFIGFMGRPGQGTLKDIWNSPASVALRRSILAGDYKACNPLCPREA